MTVEVHARRTLEGLEELEARIAQVPHRAISEAIKAAEAFAKATPLFKDKSSETRQSIKGEYTGEGRGRVVAGGVARLLEEGTSAHTIVGRPILRFTVAGQVLFRRMVRHPGTQPRPFMTEARAIGYQAAHAAAEFYAEEAIRSVR